MHELSVAQSLVELVEQRLADEGPVRVASLRVSIGPLCGVDPQALRFAFDAATNGTPLSGARLDIEPVELVVWCPKCATARTLPGMQRLRCPVCDERTPRVLRGRELEILSVEVCDAIESAGATADSGSPPTGP